MKITRFYATTDGESRFENLEIPLANPRRDADGHTLLLSHSFASPGVCFVELPDGLAQDWHQAPTRQIVVVLSGTMEVTTSDGQTRRWTAGEAFLADDVTGKGHRTRTIGGRARLLFAPIPAGFDLGRWSV